ncbi:MAG TPA: HlyD family secretion protein [Bryobacteraceae bacterium]|nr:HlyD family secretion protein [Bryobacteraceae bacterium]
MRIVVIFAILSVLAAGSYYALKYFGAYESTDDAQVDGHINAISARINGYVTEVLVDDEQVVKAGDVLVRIDPKDYNVALANAEADLAAAEATFESNRTDVPITSTTSSSQLNSARSGRADADAALAGAQRQLSAAEARLVTAQAQVREAEATYKKNTDDVTRYKLLVDKDEISQQTYDTSVFVADAQKATVDARRAAVAEAEQNVRVTQTAIEQANARIAQADATIQSALTAPQQIAVSQARAKSAQAQVAQRRALVDQAKLNLSYCTIVSPVNGIVGKKTVEVGGNISPGQQLMAVVPLDDIWITANFKETQLRLMKPGQRVKFSVDAYDREYNGKLSGIGGASGSILSLLPPENATGNYVKVVQRIPVRIDIDPNQNSDHRLRPGMSVVPKVYVH